MGLGKWALGRDSRVLEFQGRARRDDGDPCWLQDLVPMTKDSTVLLSVVGNLDLLRKMK